MLSHISIRRYTMSGCFIFDPSSHWSWFKTAFEVEKLWFLLCHSVFILELEFISIKQKLSQVNHLVILRYFFKLEAWKLLSALPSFASFQDSFILQKDPKSMLLFYACIFTQLVCFNPLLSLFLLVLQMCHPWWGAWSSGWHKCLLLCFLWWDKMMQYLLVHTLPKSGISHVSKEVWLISVISVV